LLLATEVLGECILSVRKLNPHQHCDFLKNTVLFILPACSVQKHLANYSTHSSLMRQLPKEGEKKSLLLLLSSFPAVNAFLFAMVEV